MNNSFYTFHDVISFQIKAVDITWTARYLNLSEKGWGMMRTESIKIKITRKLISGILLCAIAISAIGQNSVFALNGYAAQAGTDFSTEESNEGDQPASFSSMSDKQLSSISMLNHMTVLSQEINASSNSKLYLDNAYSDIVNNINPNAVDEDSLDQIKVLLNTIYAYQSIETKRERLKYIYEQNQAKALQQAVPNPILIHAATSAGNPIQALFAVSYMAYDAASSYKNYLNKVEAKYLEDGWVLEDSAAESLHESRKEAFSYMVEMCQKHNLDGKLALNEKSVESFVEWENNTNATRRIDYLEKNKQTYQAYGKYWVVLAESYYEKGDFAKCLDAITAYENMHIDTFRKDHDLAKASSMAIAAAQESQNAQSYISTAEHYLDLLLANIEPEDWMLRYFAAQTYVDLYSKTKKESYLQSAYDLAETNVNYLIDVQMDKNNEYLADIVKQKVPKNATKEQEKEVKTFNKWIEEERKVALPPVYQPLVSNCDLLFALADELNITDSQKQKIEDILFSGDQTLFMTEPLNALYHFDQSADSAEYAIEFDGKTFEIPVTMLEQGTTLKVTVKEGGKDTVYEDWSIDEVDREEKGKVETFTAEYKSKEIKKQKYSADSRVFLDVIPPEGSSYSGKQFEFKTKAGKKLFLLKDIDFEMVK